MYNSGNSSKNVAGSAIIDGTVETVDIADDAVTVAKLDNAVNNDIADGVAGKATADLALPKAGGALTGAVTTNSTFDGRDVATDGAALDVLDLAINSAADAVAVTIDANENVGIGAAPSGGLHKIAKDNAVNYVLTVVNSSATTPYNLLLDHTGVAAGDSSRTFIAARDTGGTRFRLFTDGSTAFTNNIGLTSGDLRIKTAGKGIDFSGVGTAAEILDDYEEGTWTPEMSYQTIGDLAITHSTQSGSYTKIGDSVTLYYECRLSAFVKGTASGTVVIRGLPFIPGTGASGAKSIIYTYGAPFARTPIAGAHGNGYLLCEMPATNGPAASLDDPDANSMYFGTVTYKTSA
jgi:hypothetical protein